MPFCWEGGATALRNKFDSYVEQAEDDEERENLLQRRRIIEVGRYTRNKIEKGCALYALLQMHVSEPSEGHFAEAYGLANSTAKIAQEYSQHCSGSDLGQRVWLHFCCRKRGSCLVRAEGHEVLHVDLYRELVDENDIDGLAWVPDDIDYILAKVKEFRQISLPHWRDCVDEKYYSKMIDSVELDMPEGDARAMDYRAYMYIECARTHIHTLTYIECVCVRTHSLIYIECVWTH